MYVYKILIYYNNVKMGDEWKELIFSVFQGAAITEDVLRNIIDIITNIIDKPRIYIIISGITLK